MRSEFKNAAKASIAPRVARGFRFSWLAYGAVAYFGLKYLNKRGILPKQTDAALGLMNKGIDFAKNQIGLGDSSHSFASQKNADQAQSQMRH